MPPHNHPGEPQVNPLAPTAVIEFRANDNREDIPTAIDALDSPLGLSTPGAALLLVIVSGGARGVAGFVRAWLVGPVPMTTQAAAAHPGAVAPATGAPP
jgi:hypothetical protein